MFSRIRISSIADEEVASRLREVSNSIQESLSKKLEDLTLGAYDQMMVTLVASEDSESENLETASKIKLTSRYKNIYLDKSIKLLNFGVALDKAKIKQLNVQEAHQYCESQIAKQIEKARLPADPIAQNFVVQMIKLFNNANVP
jgi:hypothetical protein